MTGTPQEANEEFYLIEADLGPIRIRTESADCIGDACPDPSNLAPDAATEVQIEWDVSLWGKRRASTEHIEKIAELVAEETDGAFTLNISYGGLSDSRKNLDGIAAGAFEMAGSVPGITAKRTQRSQCWNFRSLV
ncbi:MAG: hypothetical protein AAFQ09_12880 [Pseudomonadota bacterium]